MMLQRAGPIRASRPVQRVAARKAIVCQVQKQEDASPMKAVALPLASMVAAALIAGAAMPEDALAASQRSGGRVGGSSGFASRKMGSAPSRSIQTQAAPRLGGASGSARKRASAPSRNIQALPAPRLGGASGFARKRASAPSQNIQARPAPTVVNSTTVVVAPSPPVFSPFGFSPFGGFGGFGFGFGVPIFMPGSVFSGLLGLMAVTLLFSVVFNVIRGIASASQKAQNKKDDSWGDL